MVVDRDRFLAYVAARHHQSRKLFRGKEQMVQRRVWQEYSEIALAGRHALRRWASHCFFGSSTMGRWRLASAIRAASSTSQSLRRGIEVRHHQGKGFFDTAFALTKPLDRHRIGCIRGKMKTAEAFDGDHFAHPKVSRRFPNRIGCLDTNGRVNPTTRAGGRIPSRRSVVHGSGDCERLHTRRGTRHTWETRASRCGSGRKGCRARS